MSDNVCSKLPGRERVWAAWAAVVVGCALAYNHTTLVAATALERRFTMHSEILAGTASSPFRYRVLAPGLADGLFQILAAPRILPEGFAWVLAYFILESAALAAFLYALYRLCRRWHSPAVSLIGLLVCGCVLPLALRDHYFQPWSWLEPYFFTMALVAGFAGRPAILFLLVPLACLNRETGVFVPVLYWLAASRGTSSASTRSTMATAVAGLLVALGTIAGLRLVLGFDSHSLTLGEIHSRNLTLTALGITLLRLIFFLGLPLAGLWMGWGRAPAETRRLLLFLPPYILVVAVFGVWSEVRLLVPLLPVLIPAALFASHAANGNSVGTAAEEVRKVPIVSAGVHSTAQQDDRPMR